MPPRNTPKNPTKGAIERTYANAQVRDDTPLDDD
jgi:hypothetical protein